MNREMDASDGGLSERRLPSGTVTFLFTDIEGSTENVALLGNERYAELLDIHRKLLREAFATHDGHEVGTEGDSFFVAFARAQNAVAAAVDGQRALGSDAWPGEARLRVRMGLHTGEALVRQDGYVGHEVHRAKRISDAGHGGQILVSQTTADLMGTNVSLADLGSHRLKDLGEPQRIYQLIDDELQREFPPLRSLAAFTHNLPLQRSSFVGREPEIAEIRKLLEGHRIVTLTGVGGSGKTRLALQVGADELDRYADGVFFVNLAPVSDPDLVLRELASSVGVPSSAGAGVGGVLGGTPAGPGDEVVLGYLAARECLIVLDNCEHVLDACADVVDRILSQCSKVTILATSREGLRVEGEQSWVVPSLSVPTETIGAAASESVSLFKERAQAVRPEFDLNEDNIDAVTDICRRLDGIPLAIEFAAARVSHLSPRQIADRLDDRFRLLTGGQRRVQRQQTLQAALDWSHDLLNQSERIVLRRLSAFVGHFGIEAAEGICTDDDLDASLVTDLIGSLVSKSLVLAEVHQDEVRYRLLDTVRAYASERLAHAGEGERFRVRHRDWYLAWVESVPWDESLFGFDFVRRATLEEPNLRGALEWSAAETRPDIVGRIIGRVFLVFLNGDRHAEVYRWTSLALQSPERLERDTLVACLAGAGQTAYWLFRPDAAELTERAVDESRLAAPALRVYALIMRVIGGALEAAATGDDALAARCDRDFDEAIGLSATLRGEWSAFAFFARASADMMLGRIPDATAAMEEAARRLEAASGIREAVGLYHLALAHVLGDHEKGAEILDGVLTFRARFDDIAPDSPLTGFVSSVAAVKAKSEGIESAWIFLHAQRHRALRSGLVGAVHDLVLGCVVVAALEGDQRRAAMLLSWIRSSTFDVGIPLQTPSCYVLYVHYRRLLRDALGPEEAKRMREAGAHLSSEKALELAFGEGSAL
jgi:predicted ATPase/class 3 adenylate cyclase